MVTDVPDSNFPLYLTTISVASLIGVFLWHSIRLLSLPEEQEGAPNPRNVLSSAESNLQDEYAYTSKRKDPDVWKLKSLWIFPIKSCHGIELKEARVVRTGLQHDRQYTFAEWKLDPKTGEEGWIFITQRQYPLLARVTTKLIPQKGATGGSVLGVGYPVSTWVNRWISMTGETLKTFELPLEVHEDELSDFPLKSVRIWKEIVTAFDMTSMVPAGFAQSFGAKHPVALFRMPPSRLREVFRCAPTKAEVGYQPVTAFADAYPLHLINLASVRDLNSRIEDTLPKLSVIRFRPNIIISGPGAYEEDAWKRITIGNKTFYTSCRTVRCKMPNVDQETGDRHSLEPDHTMRQYRCVDPGYKLGACMGMQVVPAEEEGIIRVGDPITVLETGDHLYIQQ